MNRDKRRMKMNKTFKPINKKRYFTNIRFLLVLTIVIILNAMLNTAFVKTGESSKAGGTKQEKYYKSIAVEYGDTLWGIAVEFKDSNNQSIQEYIDEVKQINQLKTEEIHAGRYLTIPYYNHMDNSIKIHKNFASSTN